jgi:DNA-binding MarR family transcriptional regulator
MMMDTTTLSPHHKSLMTPQREATAKALFLALEPFVKVNPNMSMQNFMTFLRVASGEGRGVTEYANDAQVWKTVMTRHLLDLGDRDRHGDDGLDFITQVHDRKDKRINRAWVAHKGAAFLDSAHKVLTLLIR